MREPHRLPVAGTANEHVECAGRHASADQRVDLDDARTQTRKVAHGLHGGESLTTEQETDRHVDSTDRRCLVEQFAHLDDIGPPFAAVRCR